MKKNIVINYFYNLSYQILSIVVPLITTPYLARALGVEKTGTFSYVSSVVGYFILCSQLGLALYGRREVAYVKEDRKKVSLLFEQMMLIRCVMTILCFIVYGAMLMRGTRYTQYYLIMTMTLLAAALDITWFYQAFEEFKVITIRNFIIRCIETVCIFTLVKKPDDLSKYIFILGFFSFISQGSLWLGLGRYLQWVPLKKDGIATHFKGALCLFVPQIIITAYTLMDKMILGIFTTDVQVGLYAQSEKIIKISLTIVTSMSVVMMPRIAFHFAGGKTDEIQGLLEKTRSILCFLSFPIIFGIFGVSGSFTTWFFGAGYEPVSQLMCIISPIVLFIALSDLYGMQFLIPTKRNKEYICAAAMGAMLNVCLNLLLVKRYQAFGVAFATVFSELLVALMMWYFARQHIQLAAMRYWKNLCSAALMGFSIRWIDSFSNNTIWYTGFEIMLGILLYLFLLWIFKDEVLLSVKGSLKKRI